MMPISDVHLAIAFTLPPKLLIHLNIKHSLSKVQVKWHNFIDINALYQLRLSLAKRSQ